MLACTSALAMFIILFANRTIFDSARFELSLAYSYQASGEQETGLPIKKSTAAVTNLAGSLKTFDPNRLTINSWTFPENMLTETSAFLHSTLKEGALTLNGITLDEATARRLNVTVGEKVAVQCSIDSQSYAIEVAGITLPFHDVTGTVREGLIILPSDKAEQFCIEEQSFSRTTFFAADMNIPTGAREKWRSITGILTSSQAFGPLVVALFVCGLVVWLLALYRTSKSFTQILSPRVGLLADLGVSKRLGEGYIYTLLITIATIAVAGSSIMVRQLSIAWANLYITVEQLALTGVFFLALTLPVTTLTLKKGRSDDS